jgi:uncharacterized OB-fold protein
MTKERDETADFAQRVDAPYWDGLAHQELRVQQCSQCRYWQWPADWRCPACGSYELGWTTVAPEGVIYSWIRTHYPFVPGYGEQLPYVSVLVELPAAGNVRMMGLLVGDTTDPHIGDRLAGEFAAATSGTLDLPVLHWRKQDGAAR